MIRFSKTQILFSILPLFTGSLSCVEAGSLSNVETVVRFSIKQGMMEDIVDLKLFETKKPVTVSNFMSYTLDGSYSNSFIHRMDPGFIIQGGSFNYNLANTDFLTSWALIPSKGNIVNELGISNLRGTIAMATVGGNKDSATSGWFINLDDNSTNLDDGFTVFGETLNNGVQTFESIADYGKNIYSKDAPFGEIPLVDYLIGDVVLTSNLVQVVSTEGLFRITSDNNYGNVPATSNIQADFFVENISDTNIAIGNIGNVDPASTPYSLESVGCQNSTLIPGDKCIFSVTFSPKSSGVYNDSFNLEFPGLGIDYTIDLSGAAGIFKISPDHDYGTVTPGSNLQPEFFIENISDQDISIGDFSNAKVKLGNAYRLKYNACDNSILSPGEKCNFVVAFYPQSSEVTFKESLKIEFPELLFDYAFNVTGESGVYGDESDIAISSSTFGFRSADFGAIDIFDPLVPITHIVEVSYQNIGVLDLNINSIELITSESGEFSLQGDCLLKEFLVQFEPPCKLHLSLVALTSGYKKATVRVNSDDPDEPAFDFIFTALAIPENDGVDESIENLAPNNGDGNYDGVLDSQQGNVVSIQDRSGSYVILTAANDVEFRNVHFVDQSEAPGVPINVATKIEAIEFTIANINVDGGVSIGMILPPFINPASFYVFGQVDNSGNSDWFEFYLDGISGTGSNIISGTISETDVRGTFVTLYLRNAVRGDSNFDADNEIKVVGAFYDSKNNDSSGQLNISELCFLLFVIIICRLKILLRVSES